MLTFWMPMVFMNYYPICFRIIEFLRHVRLRNIDLQLIFSFQTKQKRKQFSQIHAQNILAKSTFLLTLSFLCSYLAFFVLESPTWSPFSISYNILLSDSYFCFTATVMERCRDNFITKTWSTIRCNEHKNVYSDIIAFEWEFSGLSRSSFKICAITILLQRVVELDQW